MGEKTNHTIETIIQGCPICASDVKGNDQYLFFCKTCNVLFHRKHLRKKEETIHHDKI
jgi:hypothetical protein